MENSIRLISGGVSLGSANTWTADQTFNADVFIGDGFGVVIGHTAQIAAIGATTGEFQIHGTGGNDSSQLFARWGDSADGPNFIFGKSRGTTIGDFAIVEDNDVLGNIQWVGADGDNFGTVVARIQVTVDDSSPTGSSIGGDMVFSTAAGASADDLTTAMTINNAQEVGIGIAPVTGSKLTLPQENDSATPTFAFGTGTDGIYSSAGNVLSIAIAGDNDWEFTTTSFRSLSSQGPQLAQIGGTVAYTFRGDPDTGMGRVNTNILGLFAGNFAILRMDGATTTDNLTVALFDAPDMTVTSDATTSAHMIGVQARTHNFNGGVNITTPIDGLGLRILAPVVASDSAVIITQLSTFYVAAADVSDAEVTATRNLAAEIDGPLLLTSSIFAEATPTEGAAGEQLESAGAGAVVIWASAASRRENKIIHGEWGIPHDALDQILDTPVYRFNYAEGMRGTGDFLTEYVGVMADEAPWAMHHEGSMVSPVNTLGYMVLGFKAVDNELEELKQENADLRERVAVLEGR